MKKLNHSINFEKYSELVEKTQKLYKLKKYEAEKIVEINFCTNTTNTMEEVLVFYRKIASENSSLVNKKSLFDLDSWETKKDRISHSSGKFFEIIGLTVNNSSSREVGKSGWDQPILREKNNIGGLLGLIRTYIDGMPVYLVEAKFEPGNYNDVLLSPTIQATFSNIEAAHGGRIPNYYNFFNDYKDKKNYIFNNWLTEDGGRLYKKRNLGLVKLVDFKEIQKLKKGFLFISLYQLRYLSKNKSIVNPHLMRLMNF
tara:strand:+ start:13792 stop:14559 length:768 start_codon:yes stop_codon:yes gene_type:complete